MAKRQALGRQAGIGDLYDIRTDSFCNKNMFGSCPPSLIKMEDFHGYEFRSLNSRHILQVLALLRVEGELQLSVASGLCEFKGVAKQLVDKARANGLHKEILGVLFTSKTKKATLCLENNSGVSHVSNLQMADEATHIVGEVIYGFTTFIYLEYADEDLKPHAKEDSLKKLLKIVENCINNRPNDTFANVLTFLNHSCKILVFSDTLTGTSMHMNTIQDALDYVKSITMPQGDHGVPLSYVFMPISSVRTLIDPNSKASQQLRTVPNDLVCQLIKRMEENVAIKNKVYTTFDAIQKHGFCISDKDLRSIQAIKVSADTSHAEFRKEFADLLVDVRSCMKHPSVLENFRKEQQLNAPKRIEQLLAGLKDALDKAEVVNELLPKGVRYVGKDVLLNDLVSNIHGKDIHVLHHSTVARKSNQVQWKSSRKTFDKLVGNPNNTCVFYDHDFEAGVDAVKIGIDRYRNGKMVGAAGAAVVKNGQDGQTEQDTTGSPCYAESPKMQPAAVAPKRKAYLRLPCPGAVFFSPARKSFCSKVEKTWNCKKCQNAIVYGFDEKFYCSCGSGSCCDFGFMCNDRNHGAEYVAFGFQGRSNFLQALGSLQPLKELNILLLGETGVGKSTWINSFVNYLTYETMEDAELNGPRYLIASSFVMTDDKYQPVEIKMGVAENENNSKGQSTTQMPKSYVFSAGDLMVRLIDTPGVGDTRGIQQDKVNFQNVLSHLAHLDDIHGICILMKSNSARMTITFQFCIKELLTHLHKDACKNIVFVFTNARETFYRPGDTFGTLRSLLSENKDIAIELSRDTIYCMDNEAVRFLAATKQGVAFRPGDRENYSISWKTSVEENERLVQHILSLTSHSTRKTLSLNEAKRLILGLTEPLAQISQNIQNNIILAQNRQDEIKDMDRKSKNLKDRLNIPVMDIEPKTIPYPRTVCTSSSCTDAIDVDGVTKVNYKTWCHEHCYLKNVQTMQYPCPELQNCAAMKGGPSCTRCGCSWEVHMHITYECVEVMIQTVDKNVERLLNKESNSIKAVEMFIKGVEQRIADLKNEQDVINKVASKCGNFLKQNAITPYNDSVDEYLQQCIRIQKDLVCGGGSDKTLKGLEKLLAGYRQEVKILEMSMKDTASGSQIGPDDIQKLIGQLYKLPINGQTLKDFVDVAMGAQKSMALYQEKVYDPPNNKKSPGFLKRAFNKAMGSLGGKMF